MYYMGLTHKLEMKIYLKIHVTINKKIMVLPGYQTHL